MPGMAEFEIEAAVSRHGSYVHEPPWMPAPVVDDALDLDDEEPDIDPDEIDWDEEFDTDEDDSQNTLPSP